VSLFRRIYIAVLKSKPTGMYSSDILSNIFKAIFEQDLTNKKVSELVDLINVEKAFADTYQELNAELNAQNKELVLGIGRAANKLTEVEDQIKLLKKKLMLAREALKFAIEDVSTGHWEDDCMVPPTYNKCDHCQLKDMMTKIKENT
jgi:methyl coenzyme M reductase subunit C-like uncharacterized protein (methanogenesis marker protein 7)